jgi:asparagine synthase (glutamine-hydrolysing)
MSRLAVLMHRDDESGALAALQTMLSVYAGSPAWLEGPGAILGIAQRGPGGLARHPLGLLALDGLLYDLPVQRKAVNLPDGDDAKVLAELIARHGVPGALAQVNGDFALAWLEADSNVLWLARDPFGMRPLYYARAHKKWAASSQPRGLLALDWVSTNPDRSFLVRYGAMHYRMIDNEPERSPYADISQVPAATAVRLNLEGEVTRYRYWSLTNQPDFTDSETDLAEAYRELLLDSVTLRLARFPKRVFTLSGGMDSSSVLACAVAQQGQQLAFSCIYEDRTFDERNEIADMLPRHVSDWRQVVLPNTIDVVAEVDHLIQLHDEPVATATWLSHMYLCQKAGSGEFDAMFGGLGGDELNAGEYEYFPFHFADLKYAGHSDRLKLEIEAWIRYHNHPVFKKTPTLASILIDRLTDSRHPGRCLPDQSRLRRYLHVLAPAFQAYQNYQPEMETFFTSCLKTRTWQDLSRETLPCCIRAEDRHGAAYGIPPVLPFLDKRLVEFMYRVPGSMKIRDGVTKRLLRSAMKGLLPETTRMRIKKTGWNAPAHLWFRGRGADELRDLVHSKTFRDLELYEQDEVIAIINDHERILSTNSLEENHMMFLWALMNLLRWRDSILA